SHSGLRESPGRYANLLSRSGRAGGPSKMHPRSCGSVQWVKGSMRERRAGVWELIVQLPRDSTTSRSRQLSRTVHGTKREAQRALAALVTEVSAGKVSA